jgi:hypothetical protein
MHLLEQCYNGLLLDGEYDKKRLSADSQVGILHERHASRHATDVGSGVFVQIDR